MSRVGYSSIEPLGGFHDKGRDAVHVCKGDSTTTVFAYSVREDWRAKLAEDIRKIHEHGHSCDQFVFITTARFSPNDRDEAIATIKNDYGWALELYGVERLRVLLDVDHPDIKKLHPQIFPAAFLEFTDNGVGKDHIFISFAPADQALARWLTQKLTAAGYKVWCESFSLLGGENYPDDVDKAITQSSFRFIALYSRAALQNPEVSRHRALALSLSGPEDFVIPLNVDDIPTGDLDKKSQQLQSIAFENWSTGLAQLLKKLESTTCPRDLQNGRSVAAEAFTQRDYLSNESELLLTNFLRITKIPQTILQFHTEERIPWDQVDRTWPFKYVKHGTLYSLQMPSAKQMETLKLEKIDEYNWERDATIGGISSVDLLSELLRKCIEAKCYERGLKYCQENRALYFPSGLISKDHVRISKPNGKSSYVNIAGKRKFWRPTGSSEYMYHIAPDFYVRRDIFGRFSIAVRIKVRFTDTAGYPLSSRTAVSRRKHLCKDWWNDKWLNLILAVTHYLGQDGLIVVGEDENQVEIGANPVNLRAPRGVNEDLLGTQAFEERDELLSVSDSNSDEVEQNDV